MGAPQTSDTDSTVGAVSVTVGGDHRLGRSRWYLGTVAAVVALVGVGALFRSSPDPVVTGRALRDNRLGPMRSSVPDVVGEQEGVTTEEVLREGGVRGGRDRVRGERHGCPRFGDQPEPRRPVLRLDPGAMVQITISAGRALHPQVVPELRQYAHEARTVASLVKAGFFWQVICEPSADIPAESGNPFRPGGGTLLEGGGTVVVAVSSKTPANVPRFRWSWASLTEISAIAEIRRMPLSNRCQCSKLSPRDGPDNGRVLAQEPAAATPVEPSSTIVVVVGHTQDP